MKRIAIVVAAFALTLSGTTAAFARVPGADRLAGAAAIAAQTTAAHAQPVASRSPSPNFQNPSERTRAVDALVGAVARPAPAPVAHPAPSARPFAFSTPIALALTALLAGLAGVASLVWRGRHARAVV